MIRHTGLVILLVFTVFNAGCTLLNRDPQQAYKKGTELAKEGKTEKAYKYFLSATKSAPDSASYHWAAAQTAQNQNAAFIHTEMAWKSGMKTVPVLAALMRLSLFTDNDQRTGKMLSLFGELPDTLKTPMLKAELYSQLGISDSSLAIWNKLYSSKPTPLLSFKIGREMSVTNDIDGARKFLETARKAKFLDASGYVLLASMRAFQYDYEGVEEIFRETQDQWSLYK